MSKYKVSDRVITTCNIYGDKENGERGTHYVGEIGTIISIYIEGIEEVYTIKFDNPKVGIKNGWRDFELSLIDFDQKTATDLINI